MSETRKIRLSYLIFTILLFSIGFLAFTYQQMPNYFKKDLMSYDECTNAVVSNNLYRDAFPPRLRLNSLTDEYQGWKEGPDWQHIPPLFLYAPFPLYYLDGRTSIEVRRLSYVFIAYLQGLIFIIGISLLFKEKRATLLAALAACFWTITPFVRGVLNGNYFGYSDIVLSCSVTLSLLMTIGLHQNIMRKNAIKGHLLSLAIVTATIPLLVKNALGALPLLFLIIVVFNGWKKKRITSANFTLAFIIPSFICLLYYGICFWKSPEAFRAEFFVSFKHFGNYEGWKNPWHYFISNYLPNRYFKMFWWPFVIGLGLSVYFLRGMNKPKQMMALNFLLSYFIINLFVISIVTSKSPNFILQSYLFALFFVAYTLWDKVLETIPNLKLDWFINYLYKIRWSIGVIIMSIAMLLLAGNIYQAIELRRFVYNYASENEKLFEFGELADNVLYANTKTLFILDTDNVEYPDSLTFRDADYWMRYYILFNSGSEARRIEEVKEFSSQFDVLEAIKRKYNKVYLVTSNELKKSRYKNLSSKFERIGDFEVRIIRDKEIQTLIEGNPI